MVGCPISNKYCLYSTVKLSSTLNIDAGYFQETYIVNTQSTQWIMPSVSAAWYWSDRILQLMHIMSKLALLFRVESSDPASVILAGVQSKVRVHRSQRDHRM